MQDQDESLKSLLASCISFKKNYYTKYYKESSAYTLDMFRIKSSEIIFFVS